MGLISNLPFLMNNSNSLSLSSNKIIFRALTTSVSSYNVSKYESSSLSKILLVSLKLNLKSFELFSKS